MRVTACTAAVFLIFSALAFGASGAPTVSKLDVRRLPRPVATRRVLDQVTELLSRRSSLHEDRRQAILFDLFKIVAADSSRLTAQSFYAVDDGDVHQALDQLASSTTFEPDPMESPHPRNSLHEYTLVTPYRASPYAGLCVTAAFTVMFDPVGKNRGAATRVQAADVSTRFYYHLLDERAALQAVKATPAERAQMGKDCAAIDPGNDKNQFYAPNDRDAIEGTWLARAVIAAAADAHPSLLFDCKTPDGTKCLSELSRIPPVGIWISGCEPLPGGQRKCTASSQGRSIEIAVDGAEPQHILSAKIGEDVVIADYRAD